MSDQHLFVPLVFTAKPFKKSRRLLFFSLFLFLTALALTSPPQAEAVCPKKPILESMLTDVCWSCIFPFRIGDVEVISMGMKDTCAPGDSTCKLNKVICSCDDSIKPGITVGFWEPIRLIEIVREPYCFPSLNGLTLGRQSGRSTILHSGVYSEDSAATTSESAFYQLHYIAFPVWQLIGLTVALTEKLIDTMTIGMFPDISKCFSLGGYDLGMLDFLYLTELDPLWNDDELGVLLNPEAVLFGNPIAQAACAADCVSSTAGYPLDPLFWCAGCWGSLYPFGGTVTGPTGEANTAALLAARALAKFNRQFLEGVTSGKGALCGKQYTGFIKKTQYKLQMIYPGTATLAAPEELVGGVASTPDFTQKKAQKLCCLPIGRSSLLWQAFRTYPVKGEDFIWLVFRKKDCCAR